MVANEVKNVSQNITSITKEMENELATSISDLMALGQTMVGQLRGSRLADLALNAIEIIDRNLYERSCDVRWWATDSAFVGALAEGTPQSAEYANKRLSVILDSYTVYLTLLIVDATGRVIANGRSNRYPQAVGADVSKEAWFRNALVTRDGSDFVVADVSAVPSLNSALVATYATAIREGGELSGKPIGVLGIFFDWGPQAETVVKGVRLNEGERASTRVMLLDAAHRVIAASDGLGILRESFPLDTSLGEIGSYFDNSGNIVGYALTPGYETYAGLGWYGVIVQQPPRLPAN